ncbi:molybdopterin-dependent oxidoreductase [Nocardioides sp. CFH 31398]|uniref:molybdopterin-dependent oxidoreductase n=1 Tax=Nocardioides sp. CFH 31398 TaxID=2919579 RepID=UPI001F055C3A|nr:molybdopterin-dependent oxidoreductase [Nocardioides sp. CFH 31398]MCH1867970.1 molybdopterin-dependent oxidoreductase [Nocardioides sp. CFH 31398]
MKLLPSARTASYAGAGVLAALAGTAAGHLTASLLDPASSPVLAVGSTVIDATPTPVKEWAIATFGSADKVILVGSVLVVTLVLAGVAGVLARRTLAGGLGLLLALVALAGAAAVLRPTAGVLDVLPAVLTAAVGAGVLVWFARRLRRATPPEPWDADSAGTPTAARASRRGVLVGAGAVAVVAVGMAAIGQAVGTARTRLSNISLPRPTSSPKALPAGLETRVDGVSPFVTPAEDFYRVDINLSVPVVDESSWTLTIDGDVETEVSFTYAELLEMDTVEKDITLTCVSNYVGGPYVGSARWQGIPIKDLLDRAGIDSTGADQILSTSVDGFTMSTPLEVALDGRDTLLVIGMNGEPLPRDRGFPARLVTPGIYGYVGACKWITKMTLTTYDEVEAYWTERDWAIDGPIKISSRIDTPEGLSSNPAGEIVVAGVAWAQTRGIGKVQVRVDGGAWQDAELGPDAGVDYWRQWFYRWKADSPGQHLIATRAITDDGEVQTAAMAEPFPNGSSGIQEIVVNVS